ncbi:MAG: tetraacyldisaccharide 4'-kinase, partial [Verrucomicrobiae bacterium]|nr:tetraacyldisaccharide 4'-kinase [Verrucomicrobiae bacterium]
RLNPHAEIIECAHQPLYLQDVFTGEQRDLSMLQGLNVAAISGIAVPESFEEGLRKLGARVIYAKRYADHHRYTQQEILNMINRSLRR